LAWYEIELRVFYGWILSGVFFIAFSRFFKMDRGIRNLKEFNSSLTGEGGDFVEKYRH